MSTKMHAPLRRTIGALVTLGLCNTAVVAQEGITWNSLRSRPVPAAERIAYGDDSLQFGVLRLPVGQGPFPVVVFMHGGCWLNAYDLRYTAPIEDAFRNAGFAVWSIEYRRVGDSGGGWPGTFIDVARGADHLHKLARDRPLDLNRVVSSGHSAGGAFALWLAARGKRSTAQHRDLLSAGSALEIHGVLGLAPAPDLESLHAAGVCGKVIDRLMGGSPAAVPDHYASVSPFTMSPIGVPQFLVIGLRDSAWAPSGRSYVARARSVGDTSITVIDAPESGHFDLLAPETASGALTLEALRNLLGVIGRKSGR
ncbi:MAG: alpha/beta hydrolase family protein [Gemmatimonadota bacterium]